MLSRLFIQTLMYSFIIGEMNVSNLWYATFRLHPQRKLVDETDKVTVFFNFNEPHTLLADARTALRKMYGDDMATDATPLELSAWPKLRFNGAFKTRN